VAAQVEALANAVEKDFGQIDVLVNNAGFTKDNCCSGSPKPTGIR